MRPLARLWPLGPIAHSGGPVLCETPGCPERTREGKPHCPEHLEDLPYVRGILDRLAERNAELERVDKNGWRAVELDGITATEITEYLRVYGERTLARIRREHLSKHPERVAQAYAEALAKAKRVTLGRTSRGNLCLRAAR